MIDTKSLKPGDPIYLDTVYSFQRRTVLKVTPTGCVDVKESSEAAQPATRFRPDGSVQGGQRWDRKRLDLQMSFDERTQWIERELRIKQIVESMRKIKVSEQINPRWGVEGLATELVRLRGLLEIAEGELVKV